MNYFVVRIEWMDLQWNQVDNCILGCDLRLGIVLLARKFQGKDLYTSDLDKPYSGHIPNWKRTLVYKQVDFLWNQERKNKRPGHLFLCTDYSVRMELDYKGSWVLRLK